MKPLTEMERAAHRRVARDLLEGLREWRRAMGKPTPAECAEEATSRIREAVRKHGVCPLWVKSFMVRIQDERA